MHNIIKLINHITAGQGIDDSNLHLDDQLLQLNTATRTHATGIESGVCIHCILIPACSHTV